MHFRTMRTASALLPLLLMMACVTTQAGKPDMTAEVSVASTTAPAVQVAADSHRELNQQMVLATWWFQRSAEARALYLQAYTMARMALERDLSLKIAGKRAVILDIDETVLDNSPFQARCIQDGTAYPTGWAEWCREARALALPGVKQFLDWADSSGVDIYYISNRKQALLDETIQNLKDVGLPQASAEHVLLRTEGNSKVARRELVARDHRVAVLLGDNLADFSGDFDARSSEERQAAVDAHASEFGTRFIMLPNPMYGDWEGALYNHDWSLDDSTKMERRVQSLRRD